MKKKIMDSSSSFEHKQIVLRNSGNFFQFLHNKRVKMKLLKFFESYELQWSRLLHFRSGREATGGLKKKKKEKGCWTWNGLLLIF